MHRPMAARLTRLALRLVLLACATPAQAATPFVGCPSDGQTGPVKPPRAAAYLPDAPAGLAYYASADLGALAPVGWHCVGLYGSDGSILIVTPEPHTPDDFTQGDAPLKGPAVQLALSIADTSGRFAAAKLAARLFPARRAFVRSVIGEDIEPASSFPTGPFPTDAVTRRGPALADYTTPPGKQGVGTMTRLAPAAEPIDGMAAMTAGNDAILLAARLPAALRGLAPAIVAAARNPVTRQGGAE